MSETLCTLRTKGGGGAKYTETSLWTNSAPTSSFAAQTVSLSGNISDYKYIAIDYCYGKDYNNITSREIYTVNDFIKAVKDSGALHTIGGLTIEDNSNISYSRPVFYISDTSVAFGVCSRLNGSGTYPTASIPTEILGLNELDHGKRFDETVLWTNANPTSSFSSQQITLSDDMANYDYLKITYRANTSLATTASALMLVSEIIASANLASVPCMSIADRNSSANGYYMRGMSYISNTVISMGTCFQTGTSGGVNSNVIPLQISGCKFR